MPFFQYHSIESLSMQARRPDEISWSLSAELSRLILTSNFWFLEFWQCVRKKQMRLLLSRT